MNIKHPSKKKQKPSKEIQNVENQMEILDLKNTITKKAQKDPALE
jgi:hypothetical protein